MYVGTPSLDISEDQLATIVEYVKVAMEAIRIEFANDPKEVAFTRLLRKSLVKNKKLAPHGIRVDGEVELIDMESPVARILGRIDLTLTFLEQHSDEDAYFAIECKRLAADNANLCSAYIREGIMRFSTGKYSKSQKHAMMLAYVIRPTLEEAATELNRRVVAKFGMNAEFEHYQTNDSELIKRHTLLRAGSSSITLIQMFSRVFTNGLTSPVELSG